MADDNRDRDRQDWNDDPASGTRSPDDTTQQSRSGIDTDRVGSGREQGIPELDEEDVDELDDDDRDDDIRDDGSPNRRRNIG